MAKKITTYQCTKCGRIYDTEEKATQCENYHKPIVEVVIQEYKASTSDVPSRIAVRDSRGNLYWYNRGKKKEEQNGNHR